MGRYSHVELVVPHILPDRIPVLVSANLVPLLALPEAKARCLTSTQEGTSRRRRE